MFILSFNSYNDKLFIHNLFNTLTVKISAITLKWLLRFYPPLFFQSVWVTHIEADFTSAKAKLYKSLLNINYNGTIYGGTIYAATDAFYPVLYHQWLTHAGYKVIVWIKSAQVQYLKPGRSALSFQFNISSEEMMAVQQLLRTEGKTVRNCITELFNSTGELCAIVHTEVYIRNLNFISPESKL